MQGSVELHFRRLASLNVGVILTSPRGAMRPPLSPKASISAWDSAGFPKYASCHFWGFMLTPPGVPTSSPRPYSHFAFQNAQCPLRLSWGIHLWPLQAALTSLRCQSAHFLSRSRQHWNKNRQHLITSLLCTYTARLQGKNCLLSLSPTVPICVINNAEFWKCNLKA